jgi:anti-anti-sigma factor
MTVVPLSARAAVLICDRCGVQDQTAAATRDSDVVWPLVADAGWTGSPFATGPHSCPECGDAVPDPAVAVRPSRAPVHGASYGVQVHDDMDAIAVTPLVDIDADFAETLRDGLAAAVRTRQHVVLDLHAVHLIDSAGLGLLVRAHQEAKHRGGSLSLVAPSRYVRTVLHTMRLDTVFHTYPDEQAAFRALRPAAGHTTGQRVQ